MRSNRSSPSIRRSRIASSSRARTRRATSAWSATSRRTGRPLSSKSSARRERGTPFAEIADEIVAALPDDVYLSWDIDGLDPTLCPGTGTPVPGGLSWNDAIGLLRAIRRARKRIVGLDLCEVAPGETEWDANVGARLLYKMIGFALITHNA